MLFHVNCYETRAPFFYLEVTMIFLLRIFWAWIENYELRLSITYDYYLANTGEHLLLQSRWNIIIVPLLIIIVIVLRLRYAKHTHRFRWSSLITDIYEIVLIIHISWYETRYDRNETIVLYDDTRTKVVSANGSRTNCIPGMIDQRSLNSRVLKIIPYYWTSNWLYHSSAYLI